MTSCNNYINDYFNHRLSKIPELKCILSNFVLSRKRVNVSSIPNLKKELAGLKLF